MKTKLTYLLVAIIGFASCQEQVKTSTEPIEQEKAIEFQNKAHELVYNMVQKVGDYQRLKDLKDVVYTYTYKLPDGTTDIVTEKYIFEGELSYGKYQKHQRTLSDLEGIIEQGYDGTNFWLKHQNEYLQDEAMLKRVAFNRKTNFYWFSMMQKLLDPGLNYKYVKDTVIDENAYDVVDVSFSSDKPTDIYQLFINQKTNLVDQFLFTVMDFNVSEPSLMVMEYEEVQGLLIPTKRKYTKSNWNAEPLTENWINVNWTDIKFNNGLDKALFAVSK